MNLPWVLCSSGSRKYFRTSRLSFCLPPPHPHYTVWFRNIWEFVVVFIILSFFYFRIYVWRYKRRLLSLSLCINNGQLHHCCEADRLHKCSANNKNTTRYRNIEWTALSKSADNPGTCCPELWSSLVLGCWAGVLVFTIFWPQPAFILFLLCALVDSAVFLLSVNEMVWLTEYWIC
jgi:hypothetical protein